VASVAQPNTAHVELGSGRVEDPALKLSPRPNSSDVGSVSEPDTAPCF
jgi:hypothetical protein